MKSREKSLSNKTPRLVDNKSCYTIKTHCFAPWKFGAAEAAEDLRAGGLFVCSRHAKLARRARAVK